MSEDKKREGPESGDRMSIHVIAKILAAHHIPCFVKDGRIYADTMGAFTDVFEETVDLTDYTRAELHDWLGY